MIPETWAAAIAGTTGGPVGTVQAELVSRPGGSHLVRKCPLSVTRREWRPKLMRRRNKTRRDVGAIISQIMGSLSPRSIPVGPA
jgi:hypothetical protein